MIIHVYTVCWNEETLMPYFLRHYAQFADRIVVYDNESDDGTAEIARAFPKTCVRTFGTDDQLRDDVLIDIKNNDWKESRGMADWVIVVDVDEFLWHENLPAYLEACRAHGISLPVPQGFEMLAQAPPGGAGQIVDEIRTGAPEPRFAKCCVFDPNRIVEISYGPGCHRANPIGEVRADRSPELKLLHYRFLGRDWVQRRWEARSRRLSPLNRAKRWSVHYEMDQHAVALWVNRLRDNAFDVIGSTAS
jgi:glycosyltransferase involved in cell wall biosynthesis